MKFFVSRQLYWPDGKQLVEVACGGLDYANPDMLGVKWKSLGEGQEFNDPCEAVEAAIKIRNAWKAVTVEDVGIDMGYTMGMTMPFDGDEDANLIARAKKLRETLPQCAQCSALLGKQRYGSNDSGEYDCCSEYCAERYYQPMEEEFDVERG